MNEQEGGLLVVPFAGSIVKTCVVAMLGIFCVRNS